MMKFDIRNAIRTPTPVIASYYAMRHQKCDPHSNSKLLCNATSEMRSALQHRILQVTMQCDIRNAIRTPTPVIASYYAMRHQKCDPHSNTGYCKLLCNGISKARSALQHRVLRVTMQCNIRNPIRT